MDNQPPKNNEQNYPNIQKSTDQKSQDPNTTNDNPKEKHHKLKRKQPTKTLIKQPSAALTLPNDSSKTPVEEPHIILATQPLLEPIITPETQLTSIMQEQDESFSSP